MRKIISIAVVCFMILTVFSGCTILQKLGLQKDNNDELRPVSSIAMSEDEAKKLTDKVPVHLYFANKDNTKLQLEVRYIPVTEAKKSVNNLAAVIVKELIKGPSTDSGLNPTIPANAKLRSAININAGVASVDFSQEFVDKHPGGKVSEQLTIYSVVNSLTELKEIQKVKFLVNGKTQKDFKGNFQFDVPFPRSTSMVSKTVPPAGSGTIDNTKGTPAKSTDPVKKDTAKPDTTKKDTAKPDTTKKDTTKPDTTKPDTTKDKAGTQNKTSPISGNTAGDAGASQDTAASGDNVDEATYVDTLE